MHIFNLSVGFSAEIGSITSSYNHMLLMKSHSITLTDAELPLES